MTPPSSKHAMLFIKRTHDANAHFHFVYWPAVAIEHEEHSSKQRHSGGELVKWTLLTPSSPCSHGKGSSRQAPPPRASSSPVLSCPTPRDTAALGRVGGFSKSRSACSRVVLPQLPSTAHQFAQKQSTTTNRSRPTVQAMSIVMHSKTWQTGPVKRSKPIYWHTPCLHAARFAAAATTPSAALPDSSSRLQQRSTGNPRREK